MSQIFVDTGYWISLIYSRDRWHEKALAFYSNTIENHVRLCTSEMVLVEFVNYFSRADVQLRARVAQWVTHLQGDPNTEVIVQTSNQFSRALALYANRLDKQWSLTDCSSFLIMTELGITDALAYDKHFEQAGFRALLRED